MIHPMTLLSVVEAIVVSVYVCHITDQFTIMNSIAQEEGATTTLSLCPRTFVLRGEIDHWLGSTQTLTLVEKQIPIFCASRPT
eukprot:scaffold33140_cov206-Skeletonema_dohrnii-CCMP3373.AAC.1